MSSSVQFTLLSAGFLAGLFGFESIHLSLFILVTGVLFGLFTARYLSLIPGLLVVGVASGLLYGTVFSNFTQPRNLQFGTRTFQGLIADDPEERETGTRLTVETKELADRSIRVLVTARFSNFSYRDIVKVGGLVEEPRPFDAFDYPGYLRSRGIFAQVRGAQVEKQGEGGFAIPRLLFSLRTKIEIMIDRLFSEPEASLLAGLLLGLRRGMSSTFQAVLIASGTTHIVAVSGFNLTIVAESIRRLLLRAPRKISFWLTSFGILIFTLLVGAPASAVRAALMVWLVLIGRSLGRKPYLPALLSFVATLMALPNPYLVRHSVSFQLSFLALVGLVAITPLIAKKLLFFPPFLREPLATTLGAQAATFPLIVAVFGIVSLVAPLSNLLILPVIPLAMFLGALSMGAGFLSLPLGSIAALPAAMVLKFITSVIEFFGNLPFASREATFPVFVLVIVLAIFMGILARAFRRSRA